MPDEPTTPPEGGQEPAAADPALGAPPAGSPDELGDAGQRALAAERQARKEAERRAKDGEAALQRLRELEDAEKTELEKLSGQLEDATSTRAQAQAALDRLEVALETAPPGMDLATVRKLAGRIQGGDREAMAADAAELFADFAPVQQAPATGVRTPVENLRPGALPSQPEASLEDRIRAAEAAGEWKLALQLKSQVTQQQRETLT